MFRQKTRCTVAAPWRSMAVIALAATITCPLAARDLTTDELAQLSADINLMAGVEASELVPLDVDTRPGVTIRTPLQLGDTTFTADLWPHSVRATGYQLLAQVEDGSLVPVEPGPVRTVRGQLLEDDGSLIAGGMSDDGLTARVRLADGTTFWIEPATRYVVSAPAGLHVVYRQEDVIPSGGRCGNDLQEAAELHEHADEPQYIPTGGPIVSCAELACDADREYYLDYNSSVLAVENRINTVTNSVNVQYEDDVEITHMITVIIVRTADPDPYSSNQSSTLLCQFITEWTQNQQALAFDVAKLFTGRNISGGVIGQAAQIGDICDRQGSCGGFSDDGAFCHSQNDCCGSFACSTDLMAHELGHLWNGSHCSCTSFTMNPFITCANQFSAGSRNNIIQHRNSRACLDLGGCVEPTTGACCFPDGTCDLTDLEGCDDVGGIYQGLGQSCVIASCDTVTSACCFEDGTCLDLVETDCVTGGGTFGDFGSACADVTCPAGACCIGEDSCIVTTGGFCATVGGTYEGDGTGCGSSCGSVECVGDLDGDGAIEFGDLLDVLSNFGPCPGCPADLDGSGGEPDGVVGFVDLLFILSNWGPCE